MTFSRIISMIVFANKRRRERLISIYDVAQAVSEARGSDGYGWVSGGSVSGKSYKYRAYSSACAAIRLGRTIYIRVAEIDAKGSSVTWFGPGQNTPTSISKWFAPLSVWPLTESMTKQLDRWTRLTPEEALALYRLRAEREKQRIAPYLRDVPAVIVTREDSLACGNCLSQTERVCKLLKADQMDAERFLCRIAKLAPGLLYYARRAVDYADRRKAKERSEVRPQAEPAEAANVYSRHPHRSA